MGTDLEKFLDAAAITAFEQSNVIAGRTMCSAGGRRLHHDDGNEDNSLPQVFFHGECNKWVSLIQNYTASDPKHANHGQRRLDHVDGQLAGGQHYTYIDVFSDHTSTANIDAVIMRNGQRLANAKVMGHLHVGACHAKDAKFNEEGVMPDTTGSSPPITEITSTAVPQPILAAA